jgi:DNA polymerase
VSCPAFIPLVEGRTQVVYGAGRRDAILLFIGEAPGKDEDEAGRPFVGMSQGQAGAYLDVRLDQIGIERADVYVTNVVKCRPTRVGKARPPKNRAPSPDEIDACSSWLDEEILLVDPKLIVPLGVVATSWLLGKKVQMKDVHGKVLDGRRAVCADRRIVPTYHPSGIRGDPDRMQASLADFETIQDLYQRMRQGDR